MQTNKKRPNILFLMCDQMRGDCMGVAGHPDVKTPYLDSLAAEGTYFPNAYSSCPSCIPARAALFTGLAPEHHGRVGYEDGIDWDYPNMLPATLSKGGYHTECIGKLHVHPPLRRCGFHNLTLHDGYIGYYRHPEGNRRENQHLHDSYLRFLRSRHGETADVNDTGLECNSWIARPWIYDEMSHPTNWAVTESIQFLKNRDPDVPFFLMTSFVRPHPPLDAPIHYYQQYASKTLNPPAGDDWSVQRIGQKDGVMYDSPFGSKDQELCHQAMAGYYGCITHIDHQIGRLLQALYEENILEDTIVIFTSDHGEMLFDHHYFRKVLPYQGSVCIPLLIRIGKNISGGQEQVAVCNQLAELRDIMPTVLDFAGVSPLEKMDGHSLVKEMLGQETQEREHLFGEHSFGELSNHYVVTKKDKLIWFSQSGEEQYFDLSADPKEEHNLSGSAEAAPRIHFLRNLLIAHLAHRPEGYSDGNTLIVGRKPLNLLPNSDYGDRS